MKRTILITTCFLLVLAPAFAEKRKLANRGKAGLRVKSIERMIRLDEDEIDLATAMLLLSSQAGADIDQRQYTRQINKIAYAILDELDEQKLKPDHRAIKLINEYLFEKIGFKVVKTADDPKDLFLHYVLDRRQGYCLSLSILYLSIGERLGLPLYGVVVPGHFFVRYDDGDVRFNIETTSKGLSADDEHYLTEFKVPTEDKDNIYMQNLSKKETLSCFFNNLGNNYLSLGDIDSALILLELATKMTPELGMVHTNLGNVYLRKGYLQDAVDEYQTALKIFPDGAKTHNNLGNAYIELDWMDEAILEFKIAIRLDPDFSDSYKNMATALCRQQLFAQAILQLRKAIQLEPKTAELYSRLGNVFRQKGDLNEAAKYLNKALLLDSDCLEAHFAFAMVYNELGMLKEEIDSLQMLLEIASKQGSDNLNKTKYTLAALQNLGNAYTEKKRFNAAIKQYKKALAMAPDDAMLHYNLAVVYVKKKDYKPAVSAYSRALQLKPDLASAHNGLATCYYFLKKYEPAWEHINAAKQSGFEVPQDLYEFLSKYREDF